MKLKDFLKEFEGVDPEAEMCFRIGEGCCGDFESLDVPDIYASKDYRHPRKDAGKPDTYTVVVTFPPLDFMDSCRKAGSVRDLVRSWDKPKS